MDNHASKELPEACSQVKNDITDDNDTIDKDKNYECREKHKLSPKAKSRVLAAATLNKIDLLKRALTGKHKDEEHLFKDEALLVAVSFRHTDCCKLLIAHDADVNTRSSEGISCLILAVQQQCHEIIKCLLEVNNCDINTVFEGDFNSCLHHATFNNDVRSTEMLLNAGCNPNLKNCNSETPLIMASERGYDEIVSILISHGADVYATKFNLRTAFHRAIEFGHLRCVKVFMNNNIDISHRDSDGRCGLHMASDKGHLNILKILIQAGMSANEIDHENQTPLFEATSRGHMNCVMALVAAGAAAGIHNDWGNTPIMSAVALGQVECLRLLLKLTTVDELNKAGFRKMTALHCSALYGHVECTNMLLKAGGDPNLTSMDALTTGHLAVKSKTPQSSSILILQLLLEINADFSTKGIFSTKSKKRYVNCFELSLCLGKIDVACWLALTDPDMKLVQMLLAKKVQSRSSLLHEVPALDEVDVTDPLVRWLIQTASQPLSLAKYCRRVIRQCIGVNIKDKLQNITLPKRLKSFLLFHEMCGDETITYWFYMRNAIVQDTA